MESFEELKEETSARETIRSNKKDLLEEMTENKHFF